MKNATYKLCGTTLLRNFIVNLPLDEGALMTQQKILEKRQLRKGWQNTRSPQDKTKLNDAVIRAETAPKRPKTKGHSNLFGKLVSHGRHGIPVMQSHQKTKAATNTHPPPPPLTTVN
jgi:hypothetical protein